MPIFMRNAHPRSALGTVRLRASAVLATTITLDLGAVPFDGEIVNIRAVQRTAGVGGTSMSYAFTRQRVGSSQAITNQGAVLALAAGAGAGVELDKASDAMATPAGCTKPTLLAAGTKVKKGDAIYATATQSGTYSTAPAVNLEVWIRPASA